MKKVLAIIFILFGTLTYAQSQNVSYEMVNDELVKARYYHNGVLQQSGYFLIVGSELIQHGDWMMFSNGRYTIRGRFNNGELVWIQQRGGERITSEQIRVHKLERKVKRLEQLIASQP